MSDPEQMPGSGGQLLQEAAIWFARMRGPEADASRPEFEAWLARGALHRAAYNRAAEIFGMGKLLKEDDPAPDLPEDRGRKRTYRALALLGAALAIVAGTLVVLDRPEREDGPAQQLAAGADRRAPAMGILSTDAAQSQSVRLADGTLVSLAGGTRITLGFDPAVRRLALEQGLARFQVARETRPFIVIAGGGRVTALGTMFDVGIQPNRRVTVRLIEGMVEVILPPAASNLGVVPQRQRLSPGQTVSYSASRSAASDKTEPAPAKSVPIHASAEPNMVRDFEGITIDELIALSNRAAARRIRLAAPGIGQRQLSGRFRVDDAKLLAERIASLFDLDIEPAATEIVLRAR